MDTKMKILNLATELVLLLDSCDDEELVDTVVQAITYNDISCLEKKGAAL